MSNRIQKKIRKLYRNKLNDIDFTPIERSVLKVARQRDIITIVSLVELGVIIWLCIVLI